MADETNDIVVDDGLAGLHSQTSAQLMEQYALESLVYTGNYLTKVKAVYERTNPEDADYNPGRHIHSLSVEYRNPDDAAEKIGDGFISTSPEIGYDKRGNLDGTCKRYAELARALGLNGRVPEEVYEKAKTQMFMTKVRETYQVPEEDLLPEHEGKRVNDDGYAWVVLQPEEANARHEYMDIGIEPRILVDRIFPIKGSRTRQARPSRNGTTTETAQPDELKESKSTSRRKAAQTVADTDIPF